MNNHIFFEYGYSFISRDRQTGEEQFIATFGSGTSGKHTAIGYAQGYIDARAKYNSLPDVVLRTSNPKKEGWRWWNEYTEWMVINKRGVVVSI